MEAAKHLTFAPRRSRLAERLSLPYVDRLMLAASIGLIAFSVFTLASATRHEIAGQPLYFATRQGLYAVVGIALMLAVCRLDYSRLGGLRITIYTAMIASIVTVLLVGTAVRESHRWIEVADFRFQPAELAKVLLCVSLAALVFERVRRPFGLRQTLTLLALGLAPAALVFLQPDLGSGLVLVVVTLAVLFSAGIPWQHFAAIAAVAAALAGGVFALGPAVGIDVLRGYQEERLTSFLHPSDDPGDASYQVNQSVIAVGSGERTGRGEEATQTELLFLPERHTDFVFAAIGERFGFLGAAFVICLYALLLWRGLRVMKLSRNFYGTLIAGGIVTMLGFQIVVNVGMNLGMMPVTGVTLPLMSYGGSSVLATFLALGLLQSIHVQAARARTLSVPLRRSARFGPLTAVAGPAGNRTRQGRRSRASTKT
ncbi:MAG: rod shape-determining protein RodA [Solirubrobacterales bacterium]